MRGKLGILGCACVMGIAATAIGSPIPGTLVPPVLGESDIESFLGVGNDIGIDWIVMDALDAGLGNAGEFAYLYQIENTASGAGGQSAALNTVTITYGLGADGSGVVSAGSLAGDDLDVANGGRIAHTLAGEEEGLTFTSVGAVADISDLSNITWAFNTSLLGGQESQTLFFVHVLGPTYGDTTISGNTPPGPWGSTASGSEQVPVPVGVIPEPATLGLLAIGGALCLFGRRRA